MPNVEDSVDRLRHGEKMGESWPDGEAQEGFGDSRFWDETAFLNRKSDIKKFNSAPDEFFALNFNICYGPRKEDFWKRL